MAADSMIVGLSVPFMYLRVPSGLEVDLDKFLNNLQEMEPEDSGQAAFVGVVPELTQFLETLITENLKPWKKTAKGLRKIALLESEWHDPQVQIEVST